MTVEDQQRAEERIPDLLQTTAACRFLSVEPLLGPVDFKGMLGGIGLQHPLKPLGVCWATTPGLDWVIVGGEAGPGARTCHVEWVRSILDQCQAAQVPAFCKQLGANAIIRDGRLPLRDRAGGDPQEWPDDLRRREFPR